MFSSNIILKPQQQRIEFYSVNVLCVCVTKLNFCIKSPDDRGEGHGACFMLVPRGGQGNFVPIA